MLDVKSFGAVGDGVHDDGPAIQAANNAAVLAKGGTVYFPPGQYLVATRVALAIADFAPLNVIWQGEGGSSVIIPKTANDLPVIAFVNFSNGYVIFRDLVFDGIAGTNSTQHIFAFVNSDARFFDCWFQRLTAPNGSIVANADGSLTFERCDFVTGIITSQDVGQGYVINIRSVYGWRGFRAFDCHFQEAFGSVGQAGHAIYLGDAVTFDTTQLPQGNLDGIDYIQNASGGVPVMPVRFTQDHINIEIRRCRFGCFRHAPIMLDPTNSRVRRLLLEDLQVSVFDGVTDSIVLKQCDYAMINRVSLGTGGFGTWFAGIRLVDAGRVIIRHSYLDGDDLYRPPVQGGVLIKADAATKSLTVEDTYYKGLEADCPCIVIKDGVRARLRKAKGVLSGSLVKLDPSAAPGVIPLGASDLPVARTGVALDNTAGASGYMLFGHLAGNPQIQEGSYAFVRDGINPPSKIRFTLAGLPYPGDIVVPVSNSNTPDQNATATAAAVNAAHGAGFQITAHAVGGETGRVNFLNDNEGTIGNIISTSQSSTIIGDILAANGGSDNGAILFFGMADGRSYIRVAEIIGQETPHLSDGTTAISPGDSLVPSDTKPGRVKKGLAPEQVAIAFAACPATPDAPVDALMTGASL